MEALKLNKATGQTLGEICAREPVALQRPDAGVFEGSYVLRQVIFIILLLNMYL